MILKGTTHAHGRRLAQYLLSPKNEQVAVLEVSGTVIAESSPHGLKQALKDMDEMGKMTRAKASLFHLALSPNPADRMTPDDWQHSVSKAEKALGLEGQPRAVVSHVYQGKEHLHVVWSRVDVETRKCVAMSFSHRKLCAAAREIEQELELEPTPERRVGAPSKQRSRDVEQHQDARSPLKREQIKKDVAGAWRHSSDGAEFQARLGIAGYQLVQGQRGPLILDRSGEAHSMARLIEGVKVSDVKERCTEITGRLPTLQNARDAQQMRVPPNRAQQMTHAEFQREVESHKRRDRGMGLSL